MAKYNHRAPSYYFSFLGKHGWTHATYNILHNIMGDLLRLYVSNKNKKFAAAMPP